MPPINIGREISIAQSSLARLPALRDFLEIVEDSTAPAGYAFRFTPTNQIFKDIEEANNFVSNQLNITDFRSFGYGQTIKGTTRGATQFAEEANLINVLLSSDPRATFPRVPRRFNAVEHSKAQERLRAMGLEQYIDAQMTVEYAQFNYPGGKQALEQFMQTSFGQNPGMLQVNDDGISIMRYKRTLADGSEEILDSRTMARLQYALGVGPLNMDFVEKLLGKEPGMTPEKAAAKLAKMPKRFKALYVARGFSLAGDELDEALEIFENERSLAQIAREDRKAERQAINRTKKLEKERQELYDLQSKLVDEIDVDPIQKFQELDKLDKKINKIDNRIARITARPNRVPRPTKQGLNDFRYRFDQTGSFFEALLGDMSNLSVEERFLIAGGQEFGKKEAAQFAGMGTYDMADPESVAVRLRNNLRRKAQAYVQLEGSDFDNFVDRLANDYQQAVRSHGSRTTNKSFSKIFKQIVESSDTGDLVKDSEYKLNFNAVLNGLERELDGQILGNVEFDRVVLEMKSQELEQLKARIAGAPIDAETNRELKELERQVRDLRAQIKGNHANTYRSASGTEGSVKAEKLTVSFKGMPGQLQDSIEIVYDSSFKDEMSRGAVESILMDISDAAPSPVRIDPLMLMYHPEQFESGEMFEGMRAHVRRQGELLDQFMETGQAPSAAVREIERQARESLDEFTGTLRAQKSRAQAEAIEIMRMLNSGVDIRSIPAAVSRISNYFATEAFRMKGDVAMLTMPDTFSSQIRTLASAGVYGTNVKTHSPVQINVSRLLNQTQAGQNLDPSVRAAVQAKGSEGLQFMEFEMRNGQMLIDGASAHLYHHSLGTFDLDDKSLAQALTFKDANGKSRFSFMTLRQPTGFQEKIFSRADMGRKENIATVLQKRSKDHLELINSFLDPNITSSMGLTAKEMSILEQVRQSMVDMKKGKRVKGRIEYAGTEVDSADIEDLIVRLRDSQEAKNLGLESLRAMRDDDMIEMLRTRSASSLGLNKVLLDQLGTETKLADFYRARNIPIDAAPFYDKSALFNIALKSQGLDIENAVKNAYKLRYPDQFQEILRRTGLNESSSLQELIKESQGVFDEATFGAIQANISAETQLEILRVQQGAIDEGKPLGTYINRQGVAVSMQGQIERSLGEFAASGKEVPIQIDGTTKLVPIQDYYRLMFSVGLVPPSEAVDASKELGSAVSSSADAAAGKLFEQKMMEDIFAAAYDLRSTGIIGEDAVKSALKSMLIDSYKLDGAQADTILTNLEKLGEGAITSTARGTGYMLADDILEGIARNERIGFDPALLRGEMSRIKTVDEVRRLKDQLVVGMQNRLEQVRLDGSYSAAQIANLETEIQTIINAQEIDDIVEKIGLVPGSQTFTKFATTSMYNVAQREERRFMERKSDAYYRQAQLNEQKLLPRVVAEYEQATDEMAETLRGRFNLVKDLIAQRKELEATDSPNVDAYRFATYNQQTKLSSDLYDFMRYLADQKSANILDVFDTMESSIQKKFGSKAVDVLRGTIYDEFSQDNVRT